MIKPTLTLAMGIFLLTVTPSSAFEFSRKGENGKGIYLRITNFSKFKHSKNKGSVSPPRAQAPSNSKPKHSVPDAGATLALAMLGFGALALGAKKLKK